MNLVRAVYYWILKLFWSLCLNNTADLGWTLFYTDATNTESGFIT